MRPLQALLVHPHIPHIKGQVEPAGPGTDHDHAALFAHQRRHRKRRLTGVLKHDIDVVALAGDIPDRLTEFTRLAKPFLVFRRVDRGQLPPTLKVFAIDDAFGPQIHHELALILIRDDPDGVCTRRVDQLDRIRAKPT